MKSSQLLFDLKVQFECSGDISKFLTAYPDQGGVWTIGCGTTYYQNGEKVKGGDTCTYEQAMEYMQNDTLAVQNALNKLITSPVTQGGFDACCDFAYEEGIGAFEGSTLLKTINADPTNYDAITADFMMWDKGHINGVLQVVTGIMRRRKCEAYLYQYGSNVEGWFEAV